MTPKLKKFLQSWVINTLSVLIACSVLKGIHYEKPLDLIIAALVLGILNAVLKPVLVVLTMPLLIVSLGLFLLIINACLLYFVGFVLRPHFYVDDFWAAFWGALIISFVSLVLNTFTGSGSTRFKVVRSSRSSAGSDRQDPGGPGGPVIDI